MSDWLNEEDTPIPDDLPVPIYWRMLVMPIKPQKVSKGGIVLPSEVQATEEWMNYIGKVVSMGGCAGKSARYEGETNIPKVGDWVVYGKYAGQKLTHKGVKLTLVNDDEILAIVKDPASLKVYI